VILSTLPGRSLDAVTARGWLERTPALEVQPLDKAERRRLIHDYLAQYVRDLGPTRTERLVEARQTSNPLYLRVLLDELRVFGIHERLNERIDWYLEARDPNELYRKVIARWEEAYADGSAVVRHAVAVVGGASRAVRIGIAGSAGPAEPAASAGRLVTAVSGHVGRTRQSQRSLDIRPRLPADGGPGSLPARRV
jgi:hypothetical protein